MPNENIDAIHRVIFEAPKQVQYKHTPSQAPLCSIFRPLPALIAVNHRSRMGTLFVSCRLGVPLVACSFAERQMVGDGGLSLDPFDPPC